MISQYESMNEEQCSEGKQDLTGVEQGEREIGEILEGKFVFLQNLGYEILVATWSTRIDSVSFRKIFVLLEREWWRGRNNFSDLSIAR